MAEFDNKTREIVQRLQAIRVKMLREQPFYAVLLMHLRFAIDESTPTAYTDGERIQHRPGKSHMSSHVHHTYTSKLVIAKALC